ncbi:hypothetical protein CDG81_22155 [Actinopolyspora erythraea]|uniref:TIGR02678 family protein n=1 Tax=Actinopolyspora erythraea TaxID=414996 RepID=A0A099D9N6_9ACTN|nr:GPP34 family phosphoprotein [Actinopolyspora erythraea]ASU80530.1 hypothetical protein CDG81_22155 [Actinopolyspora erythraea]KGI82799.1 hypothetical protein IL38_02690 [Actinopolyspora erythraea]
MSSYPRYGAETPLPSVIAPLLHRGWGESVQRLDRDLVVATAELAELVLRGRVRLRRSSLGDVGIVPVDHRFRGDERVDRALALLARRSEEPPREVRLPEWVAIRRSAFEEYRPPSGRSESTDEPGRQAGDVAREASSSERERDERLGELRLTASGERPLDDRTALLALLVRAGGLTESLPLDQRARNWMGSTARRRRLANRVSPAVAESLAPLEALLASARGTESGGAARRGSEDAGTGPPARDPAAGVSSVLTGMPGELVLLFGREHWFTTVPEAHEPVVALLAIAELAELFSRGLIDVTRPDSAGGPPVVSAVESTPPGEEWLDETLLRVRRVVSEHGRASFAHWIYEARTSSFEETGSRGPFRRHLRRLAELGLVEVRGKPRARTFLGRQRFRVTTPRRAALVEHLVAAARGEFTADRYLSMLGYLLRAGEITVPKVSGGADSFGPVRFDDTEPLGLVLVRAALPHLYENPVPAVPFRRTDRRSGGGVDSGGSVPGGPGGGGGSADGGSGADGGGGGGGGGGGP